MSPIVSVVLPTYNRGRILRFSLESVLAQTYENFELVIVDDSSTDDTESVVRSYSDRRIRYLRHPHNRGAAAARNTGIDAARGALVAFQDSDVTWHRSKLDLQVRRMYEPDSPGVVYCAIEKISDQVKYTIPSFWVKTREGVVLSELLKWNFVDTPSALVRSDIIEHFDSTLPFLEDWELFLRLARSYRFAFLDEPLVVSHYTGGGVNEQDDETTANTLLAIVDRHHKHHLDSRATLAAWYRRIGFHYLVAGLFKSARAMAYSALSLNPIEAKALALLAASFGPKRLREFVLHRRRESQRQNPIGFPSLK